MAIHQEDGCWLVVCPICGWKQSLPTKIGAQRKLANHTNIKHGEGRQKTIKQRPQRPAKDMPPQLPQAIKEVK